MFFLSCCLFMFFFFFNDTATTEIYTLSLHDALPIFSHRRATGWDRRYASTTTRSRWRSRSPPGVRRSEEHTSELQSHHDLVCRLLLEKKKKKKKTKKNKKKKKKKKKK